MFGLSVSSFRPAETPKQCVFSQNYSPQYDLLWTTSSSLRQQQICWQFKQVTLIISATEPRMSCDTPSTQTPSLIPQPPWRRHTRWHKSISRTKRRLLISFKSQSPNWDWATWTHTVKPSTRNDWKHFVMTPSACGQMILSSSGLKSCQQGRQVGAAAHVRTADVGLVQSQHECTRAQNHFTRSTHTIRHVNACIHTSFNLPPIQCNSGVPVCGGRNNGLVGWRQRGVDRALHMY